MNIDQHTRNLAPHYYVSREVLLSERQRVFWQTWQLVGPESELRTVGQYVATNIAGANVLVVRDDTGQLRCFRNVCRHRGAPLLDCGVGTVKRLRCPYHNWVYDLGGQLISAPDFGERGSLNFDDWPLLEIAVEAWRGLVFLCIEPKSTLLEQLGATVEEMQDEPMESVELVATERLVFDANWKIYTDNFVEGYHIAGIHPAFFQAIDFSKFETKAHDGLVRMTAPAADELFYRGRWLWMWPNWTLSLYPEGFNTSRINPLSERRTELLYHFYFTPDARSSRSEQLDTVARNMEVIREDFAICEQIQRNFDSNAYEPGPLSPRHEAGVAYFQNRLLESLSERS